MKSICSLLLLLLLFCLPAMAEEEKRDDETIVLSPASVKNLGIKTVRAKKTEFETTIFAIGRIQPIPNKLAVISTRFAGRIVQTPPIVGDRVTAGEILLKVESRQPGSPPPIIDIEAPSSGIIFKSHVTLGQPVEPAQELMDIVDLSQVWAVANVPESHASKISIGTRAHIRVTSLGDTTFEGELIRMGTEANPTSGTVEAIFLLDNPDMKLRPHMRTEFSIITSTRKDVVAVPRTAVQGDIASPFVFVKDYELPNAFVKVPITVGEINDRLTEITSGITRFDDVVTDGSYFLGFAQGGGISLKEALDAAHGHEHNEDGSEMTAATKNARDAAKDGVAAATLPYYKQPSLIFLAITNMITLLALILVIFRKSVTANH